MALPSRTVCRVRGIQVHGDTPRALPGQRVALNLVGDGVAALDRGEMLGVADRFGQTLRFMMTFTYLGREGTKPRVLESGARVHVMAGTAEVVGRIMLLEGEAPWRWARPVPCRCAWRTRCRCVPETMRGAVVFARYAHWRRACAAFALPSSRELSAGERTLLAALEAGDAAGGVGAWLALQMLPVTAVDVADALDLGVGEVDAALRGLVSQGSVRKLAVGDADYLADAVVLDAAMGALAATCQPCTRLPPRRRALRPAPLPMLLGLPLTIQLPRP